MDTIGVILISIIVVTIVLHGIVIAALVRRWDSLGAQDMMLLSLTVTDICQVLIGYPLEIKASLQEGSTECILAGFSTTTLSLISISIITSMVIAGMISLSYPIRSYVWRKTKRVGVLYFVLPSFIYGLMWGSFPLFGWSKYSLELNSHHRCSINFNDQKVDTLSYIYSLLVFCYILPIAIMIASFIKFKRDTKVRTNTLTRHRTTLTRHRATITTGYQRNDRGYTFLTLAMFSTFMLAWTPYAILSFYVGFGINISSTWADAAALLGKSSTFYNPIIYALMYKKFRLGVRQVFRSRVFRSRAIQPVAVV